VRRSGRRCGAKVRCTDAPVRGCAAALVLAIAVVPLVGLDRYGDIEITTFIHSSVQLEYGGKVIQIDPWSLADLSRAKPADLILITDDVGHHLDVKAIRQLRKPGAPVIIAGNGKSRVPDGIVLANGQATDAAGFHVEAIAAYDLTPGEPYHPKGEANGYVVTLGSRRVYVAGVTQCVPEITALKDIDVAFFPMNVPLARMEPPAAIDCLKRLRPKVVYPYHYDQDWVAQVGKGAPRPTPTTKGLQDLRDALRAEGIEVRLANWYPAQ
jgi:L-ascorbate metabolism protein UlaG (beta-lactamase superfamily)